MHSSPVPPVFAQDVDEAYRLFNAGAVAEAEALCERRLALVPEEVGAKALLGLIRHRQGDNEAALRLLREVASIAPEDPLCRCNLGIVLFSAGRYPEAQAALGQALSLDPGFAEAHFNLGNICALQGDFGRAVGHFREAVRSMPDYFEALANLGLVLEKLGQGQEAIRVFNLALAIKDEPALRYQMANALFNIGDRPQAVEQYRRVIAATPENAEVHFNLAITLQKLSRYAEAEMAYQQALALAPANSDTFFGLALVVQAQGRLDEAISWYRKCLAIKPDFVSARYNLGIAFNDAGRYDEAIACFLQALRLEPDNVKVINNLGLAQHAAGEYEAAIATYRRAIAIQPDFADAYSNLGNAYFELEQQSEAFKAYQRALVCNPDFDRAYYNLGCYWQKQNQIDTAISMYRRAIALNRDLVEAHWNLSHCFLLKGDFESGFKEYAWRWRRKETAVVSFPKPQWQGEVRPEASLLVYTEQGVGDTLQFVRFLPQVRQRVGKIILACEASLCELFRYLPGVDVIDRRKAAHSLDLFDCHIPLLDLPEILATTLGDLPAEVPYLMPDPERADRYRAVFEQERAGGSLKVGIVWQGNPGHRNDRNRSCRYADFAGLRQVPGTVFFSLQKEVPQSVLLEGIVDLAPQLATFADTAALISHLDLVISVDTSVAHLAGALGKPVWVLLPFMPDWRWMLYREDSPWYPSMRLFRQQRPGDWSGLFAEVQQALSSLAHEKVSP